MCGTPSCETMNNVSYHAIPAVARSKGEGGTGTWAMITTPYPLLSKGKTGGGVGERGLV